MALYILGPDSQGTCCECSDRPEPCDDCRKTPRCQVVKCESLTYGQTSRSASYQANLQISYPNVTPATIPITYSFVDGSLTIGNQSVEIVSPGVQNNGVTVVPRRLIYTSEGGTIYGQAFFSSTPGNPGGYPFFSHSLSVTSPIGGVSELTMYALVRDPNASGDRYQVVIGSVVVVPPQETTETPGDSCTVINQMLNAGTIIYASNRMQTSDAFILCTNLQPGRPYSVTASTKDNYDRIVNSTRFFVASYAEETIQIELSAYKAEPSKEKVEATLYQCSIV